MSWIDAFYSIRVGWLSIWVLLNGVVPKRRRLRALLGDIFPSFSYDEHEHEHE